MGSEMCIRDSKKRPGTSRARSASSKTARGRCASARRSAVAKGRSSSRDKATGRFTSTKARAAGSSRSSAAGRSKSRGKSASADKTSSKARSLTSANKVKRPMNCYAAYLKAHLANKKLSKVRSRDLTIVSLRCSAQFVTSLNFKCTAQDEQLLPSFHLL